jgi:hypothetical protein
LPIPSEAYTYIMNPELRLKDNTNEELYRMWPPIEMHEAIALAQHHGVPTRMLDFTFNPYIAAFFAASQALEHIEGSGSMCIWAITRFNLRNWVGIYKEVHVRRFENRNLNEQEGVFLIDTKANEEILSSGQVKPIEAKVIEKLKEFKNINPTSYDLAYPVFIKVRMPKTEAKKTIALLNRLGYNHARLMPSYDKVVNTLEFFSGLELNVL